MTQTAIQKAWLAAEHPILLETPAQLARAAEAWRQCDILGIDTEFVRERTYRADLGLVQVSDGRTAWLLDPLAIRDYGPVNEVFADPRILKILHSGSEDLEVLHHSLGVVPDPLADTQVACAMLGQPLQLGYHHALNWLFGIEIEKDQTRSNWCRRPLHPRQLRYAAMDVLLLPKMIKTLRPKLEQQGRWSWLQEEVGRMQKNAKRPPDPEKAYLRFAAASRLDSETLRTLKFLARWREQTAIERNRARGFVIGDNALLQIARERPGSVAELQAIEGLHPVALSRYGKILIDLIANARSDRSALRIIEPLDDRERRLMKKLRKIVRTRSAELAVDPALLASRRELERLIRAEARGELPERFAGWRKDVVSDELLSAIRGARD
jgi:ribonuclease D